MARPIVKKVVQDRIKASKQTMKAEGKIVTDALKAATKGEAIDAADTRTALASFIKASKAFNKDTAILASISPSTY